MLTQLKLRIIPVLLYQRSEIFISSIICQWICMFYHCKKRSKDDETPELWDAKLDWYSPNVPQWLETQLRNSTLPWIIVDHFYYLSGISSDIFLLYCDQMCLPLLHDMFLVSSATCKRTDYHDTTNYNGYLSLPRIAAITSFTYPKLAGTKILQIFWLSQVYNQVLTKVLVDFWAKNIEQNLIKFCLMFTHANKSNTPLSFSGYKNII